MIWVDRFLDLAETPFGGMMGVIIGYTIGTWFFERFKK